MADKVEHHRAQPGADAVRRARAEPAEESVEEAEAPEVTALFRPGSERGSDDVQVRPPAPGIATADFRASVLRLQRTHGNAYVQKMVTRASDPALQRDDKAAVVPTDKSSPNYQAPAFESVQKTATDVEDAIKNDRYLEACNNLNRLWIRDIIDTLKLVQRADVSLLPKLQSSTVLGTFDRVGLAFQAVTTGTMPASSTVAADQQKEVQAFTSVHDWPTKLPHAARDKQHAITADPTKPQANVPDVGDAGLSDEQKTIVDFIRRERALVQVNPDLHLQPFKGAANRGYMYTKSGAGEPRPGALTGGDQRTNEVKGWVWKEVAGEGSLAAINTYDEMILTYGKGFGAHGSLPIVMRAFLKDPAIEAKFLDAGITFRNNQWLVVNVDTGFVEEGDNALHLIQFDPAVLSRLIEIGQENQQAFADAQWEGLKGLAGAVPAGVIANTAWTEQPVRLVAHCVHWRPAAGWSQYEATGGVAKEIVKVVVPVIPGPADPKRGGARFVGHLPTAILRSFANGYAGTAMTAPAPLPPDVASSPTAYAGHVFFDAGGASFYHLTP